MPLAKLARRRYAQQPSSLRTAHDARGKYGSEIYAAASYGSMGILEKNKPHAPSPRATLLDAGEKAAKTPSHTSTDLEHSQQLPRAPWVIAKTRAAGSSALKPIQARQ